MRIIFKEPNLKCIFWCYMVGFGMVIDGLCSIITFNHWTPSCALIASRALAIYRLQSMAQSQLKPKSKSL